MVSDDAKLAIVVCGHAVDYDISNKKDVYNPI
jgi:hypothetical protein